MELKPIYKDDMIEVVGRVEGDRFFVHAKLFEKSKFSAFKHYLNLMSVIENEAHERGFVDIYTTVSSQEQARWTQFLGFEYNNEVWESGGKTYEIMKLRAA